MGHTVVIRYGNGSVSRHPFRWFQEAADFCREGISYSGARVARVEIEEEGSGSRAMWDASWNEISKAAGLRRSP